MNAVPRLLLTVDLAVRRGPATARLRAQHIWYGDHVDAVVTDETGVALDRIAVGAWRDRLGELCAVAVPDGAPPPPPDGPELPWHLLVATGAATAECRPDLQHQLLARLDAPLRARVTALHAATVGRLRAVGVVPSRKRVGWVSWLLLADGWRALVPCVAATEAVPLASVRLERRRPVDLGSAVARWVAEVAR